MKRTRNPAPSNKSPAARRRQAILSANEPLPSLSDLSNPVQAQPVSPLAITAAIDQPTSWLPMFLDFISNLVIESKEIGQAYVGEHLWGSQRRFLQELSWGMDRGIRDFTFLKSRQLGVTTIGLAIDLFWAWMHPGIHGCILIDDDGNRDKIRFILRQYAKSLPKHMRYEIQEDNKTYMSFDVNGATSVIDFLVAGKRRGTLGASRAYRFLHATEVANYGDEQGLENFLQTLSESHPDRLFFKESTANGMNHWRRMWLAACRDNITQHSCFIGWWSRDDHMIVKADPRYAEYMRDPWSDEEIELRDEVSHEYGHLVADEQLAWYRWHSATRSLDEGMLHQTQPWTAKQSFILSGRSFFPLRKVEKDFLHVTDGESVTFDGYRYYLGTDFASTSIERVFTLGECELKVWEDPLPWGRYAIGCDPAYGRSDWNDSHAISVWRCFADKIIQVAEYLCSDSETYQITWALAHLASMYEDCYVNYEVSGPGVAIKTELDRMRQILRSQLMLETIQRKDWYKVLEGIKWYLYHRPDSLGRGYAYGWKALALSTPLPTPSGWTTIEQVQVGDKLIDNKGLPCTVEAISPIYINRPCYEVWFDDDSYIVADEDHLWKVARPHWKGEDKIRKTKDLIPRKMSIRIAEALELEEIDLPIHPYTLGVWLGDGQSQSGSYFAGEEDYKDIAANLQQCGETLGPNHKQRTCYFRTIYGLKNKLRNMGLLDNKHIPCQYHRASKQQRLALLQGLMDTDGSASNEIGRSRCEFSTTSMAISVGFSELLTSLGIRFTICRRRRAIISNDNIGLSSEVDQFSFTLFEDIEIFKLIRKQSKLSSTKTRRPLRSRARKIIHVVRVGSVPVKCVQVNSPDHLYLAGPSMIPTHNTNFDNKLAIMNELRDSYINGLIEYRSADALEQMQLIVIDNGDIAPAAKGRDHDDAVFASALAHRAWLEWIRPDMIQWGYTYAKAMSDDVGRIRGGQVPVVAGIVGQFFNDKETDRRNPKPDWWAQRGLVKP